MRFCDIDPIEKVTIKFVVELGGIEGLPKMLSTRSQNLIRTHWSPVGFLLYHSVFFLWRWCKVGMSVQAACFEFDRLDLHGLDFFEILLVV
jgi:hypothetical protein